MLAKQVCRVLCNPEFLCARVSREKYYPDSKLLKAKDEKGCIFHLAQYTSWGATFNRGCIWRVGDGTEIHIWEDRWVPNSPTAKIITPRGTCLLSWVSDLIDPGLWDEILVRDIFWLMDASKIPTIPLSSHGLEDFVA